MRRSKWKALLILLMIMLFLAGLATLLYPHIYGAIVDHEITLEAEEFLSWVDITPATTDTDDVPLIDIAEPKEGTHPSEPEERMYRELWDDMVAYNEAIY